MNYSKYPPVFITVTCLEWKQLLADDAVKDIIIESLCFLVKDQCINLYAFVLMNNHFHLIWQMKGDHERENVQRDFLKFTDPDLKRRYCFVEEGSRNSPGARQRRQVGFASCGLEVIVYACEKQKALKHMLK